jgi:hypothetical protein
MALAAPGAVLDVVRRLIAGGLGAAVHLERGPRGRRVTAVAELAPDERGRARARLIRAPLGTAVLCATGHVPAWADRLDPSVRDAFDPSAGDAFDPPGPEAFGPSAGDGFDASPRGPLGSPVRDAVGTRARTALGPPAGNARESSVQRFPARAGEGQSRAVSVWRP